MMRHLSSSFNCNTTQERCNAIASALNNRPRKRHGFRTPLERLAEYFRRRLASGNRRTMAVSQETLLFFTRARSDHDAGSSPSRWG